MTTADRFLKLLKHFDLNYSQLGRVMGVKKQTISSYVNQGVLPGREPMTRLRERLGISEQWLINGNGEMFDKSTAQSKLAESESMNLLVGRLAQLDNDQVDMVIRYIDKVVLC